MHLYRRSVGEHRVYYVRSLLHSFILVLGFAILGERAH